MTTIVNHISTINFEYSKFLWDYVISKIWLCHHEFPRSASHFSKTTSIFFSARCGNAERNWKTETHFTRKCPLSNELFLNTKIWFEICASLLIDSFSIHQVVKILTLMSAFLALTASRKLHTFWCIGSSKNGETNSLWW